MDERKLSIVVFSLFFSWLLALPFEGQVLYALAHPYDINPYSIIFWVIVAHFTGLFLTGFIIKNPSAAKRLMLFSIVYCILGSGVFFFPPSIYWHIFLISSALFVGISVGAWGFFFKSGTPPNERIKTAADGLIFSNILMILINMTAIHISPVVGLGLSISFLMGALFFASRLPAYPKPTEISQPNSIKGNSILKPLLFLWLFIAIISINSGLMYQVINPAFAHHEWLVSWYWAIPYIIALYIMRNLSRNTNRTYILYIAMAMIGFAFISFMTFDRSAPSYLLVNTLMLGACGVFDLFWWSILGGMLDLNRNPGKILGIGLSANVLGVLLGGYIGNVIFSVDSSQNNASLLALAVVFIILILLPILHKQLSKLLRSHAFLTVESEESIGNNDNKVSHIEVIFRGLTPREREVGLLLIKGKTNKMIAEELFLSENTVKTHVKNIYAKLNVKSRIELVNLINGEVPHLNG